MNKLLNEIFNFEQKNVKIVGDFENPWFCARDVCEILGYENHNKAIFDHVDTDDKKSLHEIIKKGSYRFGNNETKTCYISESGLYDLISHSRMPNAKKFQKWITKEVLPELRKKGQYTTTESQNEIDILRKQFEEQLQIKDQQIEEQKQRIEHDRNHILLLKNMLITDEQRPITQVIYIATSQNYARQNRFKVGGVESVDKLTGRLSNYNSRSAQGDEFYYSDVFILHYNHVKYLVDYLCCHYNDEVEEVNSKLTEFISSLNNHTLRPIVPPPKEGKFASIIKMEASGQINEIAIAETSSSEFVKKIEEFVSALPKKSEITRKEMFDKLKVRNGRIEKEPIVREVMERLRPDVKLLKKK